MRITVFRGTKEIGGTCIEVAAGNTRVILDTSTPLVNADRSPFDARVLQNRFVDELLASGILPSVPGLFRADSPPPTAILLSHAHLDHVGLLPYTVPTIPVYATSGTSKMMLAGSIFSRQFQLDRKRHRTVNDGQSFSVGEITITPLAVDHSTYGSVAFLLRAGNETVLYSGDLRLHGRKPGMFRNLLNEVSDHRVDVLLAEGTHLGSEQDHGLSEQELETQIVSGIGETKGLILACFSPLDLDRLVTLYRSAVRTRRTFVADAYFYCIPRFVVRSSMQATVYASDENRVVLSRSVPATACCDDNSLPDR
ncbi:MAG: MBL fold metallo-hydrolase, partial [Planctomycetes bacterium]|nr:MBL fold metallo-hydrolase [Planctomycetota bacterium]